MGLRVERFWSEHHDNQRVKDLDRAVGAKNRSRGRLEATNVFRSGTGGEASLSTIGAGQPALKQYQCLTHNSQVKGLFSYFDRLKAEKLLSQLEASIG